MNRYVTIFFSYAAVAFSVMAHEAVFPRFERKLLASLKTPDLGDVQKSDFSAEFRPIVPQYFPSQKSRTSFTFKPVAPRFRDPVSPEISIFSGYLSAPMWKSMWKIPHYQTYVKNNFGRLPHVNNSAAEKILKTHIAFTSPPCDTELTNGRMTYEAIRDGLLSPRLSSSRSPLASLLTGSSGYSHDDIYAVFLNTFPGADIPSKIVAAEAWSAEHAKESIAEELAFLAIRRHFLDGRYSEAVAQADRVRQRFPKSEGRANVIKAFALTQSGDFEKASLLLAEYEGNPDFISNRAEIRFMQAWIAIEEDRRSDAKRILKSIIEYHPWSHFAERARNALLLMEEQ